MLPPKAIKLTQVSADGYEGLPPEAFVVVGELPSGETVVAWADVTGKPSTFTPATHSHPISQVTGLQGELDGKQAAGSYATVAALSALESRVADLENPA